MDRKTVEKILKDATEQDFIDIITDMTKYSREAEKSLIDWGKKNAKKNKELLYETEVKNLWNEAWGIISEFNDYGGGPECEEETACDNLYRMGDIVKEHKIPWDTRKTIMDGMLCEFQKGNSGFDDLLIDIAGDFCETTEEIRYLADALSGGGNGYYRGYAAELYKNIGDETMFLQTKLANLHYGSDYIEVAKYFSRKGDHEKELDYIWKGLKQCDGRLDELVDYIAPIYRKKKNEKELRRLYDFIMKTKWNVNISAIARQMFEYGKENDDYKSMKKMLLLLLDVCDDSELRKWFGVCQKELSEEDWEKEYPAILSKIQKRDQKFYLDICMETGKEDEVLKCLQSAGHGYSYWDLDYNQYFSKRLFEKYPNEILALYWRDVNGLLMVSNNKNYAIAKGILEKIKSLMKKTQKTEEWNRQFSELKEKHKRKKNFIALVQKM